ncbi:MAG: helix-turn-helix domain-containing protein [Lachnospiraceae bacterium]|nr:helix-turn-helix domain-containing protein [Lachnospiraceae bacterium]
MKQNLIKIIMNPIRLRIVQFLMLHEKGTTGEMQQELTDIPSASLYRHVKTLLDTGCIEVAEERKVRGTVEKTYRLSAKPCGDLEEPEIGMIFQTGLLSLMSTFQAYFSKKDVDPQKDMLSLSTSTLLLTDEEMMQLFQKIGEAYNEVIQNQPGPGRKMRRLTFISSPCEE